MAALAESVRCTTSMVQNATRLDDWSRHSVPISNSLHMCDGQHSSEKDGVCKFEQGSSLASFTGWSHSDQPLTEDDPASVKHNPSPTML